MAIACHALIAWQGTATTAVTVALPRRGAGAITTAEDTLALVTHLAVHAHAEGLLDWAPYGTAAAHVAPYGHLVTIGHVWSAHCNVHLALPSDVAAPS